ncbi:GNAT family N-acetyltransferase [Actinosynnema sp. NPDC023794]
MGGPGHLAVEGRADARVRVPLRRRRPCGADAVRPGRLLPAARHVGAAVRGRRGGGGRCVHAPRPAHAELKRIWTHSRHRRRGLARRVLAELEREAVRFGYARLYLTTGPRQPEARALYLATGYTPLFDLTAEALPLLPFEKDLR